MSTKQYPYVESKKNINNFRCEYCKKDKKKGLLVEWRTSIFRGDNEFEKMCPLCFGKELERIREDKKRIASVAEKRRLQYVEKMRPKWELLEKKLAENNIEVTKYGMTGQWSFNKIIDWWTTTGTAMHRKTRKQYMLSIYRPDEIIKVIAEANK